MNRILVVVSVLLLGIGIAGCPSSQSNKQVFLTGDGGALIHNPSHIVFPSQVADFHREGTNKYDSEESGVSAAYNYVGWGRGAIAATTYAYPSPALTTIGSSKQVIDSAREKLSRDEFERCKFEITRANPKAVIVSEGPFNNSDGQSGLMADYRYTELIAGIEQPLRSRLYLFTYIKGKWNVKHRITFTDNDAIESKVDQYVREFGPMIAP